MTARPLVGYCGWCRAGVELGKKLCKIILPAAMALRVACSRIIQLATGNKTTSPPHTLRVCSIPHTLTRSTPETIHHGSNQMFITTDAITGRL